VVRRVDHHRRDRQDQLKQNIDSAGLTLDAKTLAAIDEIHHRCPNPAG